MLIVVFSQVGLAATGRFRPTSTVASEVVRNTAATAILAFNTWNALFVADHTCLLLRLVVLPIVIVIPQGRSDRSFGLLSDRLARLLIDGYLPRVFLPSGQTQLISRPVSSLHGILADHLSSRLLLGCLFFQLFHPVRVPERVKRMFTAIRSG